MSQNPNQEQRGVGDVAAAALPLLAPTIIAATGIAAGVAQSVIADQMKKPKD